MKIQKIEINNYKAFYKTHTIETGSKNLFIYGENGSGKSSLYYALKDFFQSSREELDFNSVENIHLKDDEKGNGFVKVTFIPDKDGNQTAKTYTFAAKQDSTDTYASTDTSIRDSISLKSFLTYKHLLEIHNVKKGKEIDLFNLLVLGVLKHFKSTAITGSKELGELWDTANKACQKELKGKTYTAAKKKKDVGAALEVFNNAFRQLFKPENPDYLLKAAQPILDEFGHDLKIELYYTEAKPNEDHSAIVNNYVRIKLKYMDKEISEPHLFLNEARLSAIAISIYLGMILRHPQLIKPKILFLDDVFIGLDISNRLPLITILNKFFIPQDYQIIITTYDKPWYEMAKFYLDNDWTLVEFYNRKIDGFEQPVIVYGTDLNKGLHVDRYITAAENYFNAGDNKAAGVYLRSAFEFILKRYCKDAVPVEFSPDLSQLKTDTIWNAVKRYKKANPRCKLEPQTEKEIDLLAKIVLNPLSHNDIVKHEFSAEIQKTINAIKKLRDELLNKK